MSNEVYTKRKYVVLVALFITWIVNYLDKLSMNVAIIPITEEFGLTTSQAGMVLGVFFLSYAIMQLIGGYLSDRFGARIVIIISVLLWSIFTVITGFAWSLASLIIIRFFFGLAEGSFPSASTLSIAENFPKKERGRAKSVLTAATTVGAIVATLLSAVLITQMGWRNLFFSFGAMGLVLTVILVFALKPSQSKVEKKEVKPKVSLKKVLTAPMVFQLMLIYFGVSMTNWGLSSWMPTYLVKVKNLEMIEMGSLAVIPGLAGLVTALSIGLLLDKIKPGLEKYVIAAGTVFAAISLYLMTAVDAIGLIITFQSLTTVGTMTAATAVLIMPLKYFSYEIIGTSTGIVYFGGQMAGAVAPTVMGFVISIFNNSYNAAFLFLMIMILVSTITALFVKIKPEDKDQQHPSKKDIQNELAEVK